MSSRQHHAERGTRKYDEAGYFLHTSQIALENLSKALEMRLMCFAFCNEKRGKTFLDYPSAPSLALTKLPHQLSHSTSFQVLIRFHIIAFDD